MGLCVDIPLKFTSTTHPVITKDKNTAKIVEDHLQAMIAADQATKIQAHVDTIGKISAKLEQHVKR